MADGMIYSLLLLAASLLAFFFGIRLMHSLSVAAPFRLERLLLRVTSTPWRGLVAGAVVAAAVHSSSAVTIATVALVSAGLLPLENALGVVLGSNIGTCTTVQFLALDLARLGFPLAAVGTFLAAASRGRLHYLALGLAGLGFLLTALALLNEVLAPLSSSLFFYTLLEQWTNDHARAFLAGVIATALVQSSTLFTAAVIALADKGLVPLPTAVALVLGGNVGTCADTLVAGLWANSAGRRVALAHLLLNAAGAIAFLPLVNSFAAFLERIFASPAAQVANAHLLFNLITAAAALPFTRSFARWLSRLPTGRP